MATVLEPSGGPGTPPRELSSYAAAPADLLAGAPNWFTTALTLPHATEELQVDGAAIRYLAWGEPSSNAIVLVHGGAAHAMWWAPVAALLDPFAYVVAMDLSGHGLSGRRERYSVAQWADEIAAVADTVGGHRATVVAHSLGGIILAHAATTRGAFGRIVLVDTPAWPDAPAPEQAMAKVGTRPSRAYARPDEALDRFRLVPPQDCANDWYLRHIAWHSLRRTDAGWEWRFDPRIFANPTGDHRIARFEGDLADSHCPVALVMGDRSYLAPHAHAEFVHRDDAPLRFVADAAHHVMLDQPLGLVAELRALLATWPE